MTVRTYDVSTAGIDSGLARLDILSDNSAVSTVLTTVQLHCAAMTQCSRAPSSRAFESHIGFEHRVTRRQRFREPGLYRRATRRARYDVTNVASLVRRYAVAQLRSCAVTQLRSYAVTQLRSYAVTQLRSYAVTQLRSYALAWKAATISMSHVGGSTGAPSRAMADR